MSFPEPDRHAFRLDTAGPIGDRAVLQVIGEVDAGAAPMLREQIRDLAAQGAVHLTADLSQADFPDSAGLGALAGGLKRLRDAGGSLTPVITAPRILRTFQITALTTVLTAQRSAQDAITADPHRQHTAESEAGTVRQWCRQHGLP